ncbi:phosphatase PAP2 family protein [Paenibacillus beijingensis]|uniref:Phosphatidic acid phosphatase type 2/haloperoxidase domain-containing protein n=1 Tax=Paenibacillus beijingensis TaxID=1126833 RepID=A0A0D5NHG1_9BACL|nr:phosphatase PAP2 family protein [Paenibacillus beijingensis]AJY74691.1 hypothetical protein VN24_08970 [Paenibacillus beijingensis]
MNEFKRVRGAFGLAVLLTLGFALIAMMVRYEKIAGFDSAIISVITGLRSSALTPVMRFFSAIGGGTVSTILSFVMLGILYLIFRQRRELIFFLFVSVGSLLINSLFKNLFQRERPISQFVEEGGFSFPSGQSMAAMALYGTAAYLLARHAASTKAKIVIIAISLSMVVIIGASRIYLGAHYPSDIMGGYSATAAWLCLSVVLFNGTTGTKKRRMTADM